MYEEAQKILEYLPIRRNTPENDYINHLWQAFSTLDEGELVARPFAVMPFHLLFMMAVQYKVLRISKAYKQSTNLFFSGVGGRSKAQLLSERRSVFDIALINERTIPEIFQLIGLGSATIQKIKDLIDGRNDNFAHAKGGIERGFEKKIDEYINTAELIQKCCLESNQKVISSWLSEIQNGDDIAQFFETHFFDSYLSPRDFGDIAESLFLAKKLNFDRWRQIVSKGLEVAHDQTILALRAIISENGSEILELLIS